MSEYQADQEDSVLAYVRLKSGERPFNRYGEGAGFTRQAAKNKTAIIELPQSPLRCCSPMKRRPQLSVLQRGRSLLSLEPRVLVQAQRHVASHRAGQEPLR